MPSGKLYTMHRMTPLMLADKLNNMYRMASIDAIRLTIHYAQDDTIDAIW
jgi:hypothetical protein